jgi:hypothetical protein
MNILDNSVTQDYAYSHGTGELCALASGFRETADESLMAFLHGFFDESGTFNDPQCKVVCFSGWVGRGHHWQEFSELWDALLRSERIDVFHATDALGNKMRGEFKNWTSTRRDGLVQSFTRLIHNHALAGFSASVSIQDFKTFPSNIQQNYNNDPHYMVFETCILGILGILGKFENFTLVCDDHERYAIECYKLLNKMKLRHVGLRKKLASICFADDKQHPPLQAADLWAYLNRQEMERRLNSKDDPVSPFYTALTDKFRMPDAKATFYDRASTLLTFERKLKVSKLRNGKRLI